VQYKDGLITVVLTGMIVGLGSIEKETDKHDFYEMIEKCLSWHNIAP
jgi:hypothetical protein